jgi:subtilisin family serine protease
MTPITPLRRRLGCLAWAALALTAAAEPAPAQSVVASGELIVKLRPGVERVRGRALARGQGGDVVDEVRELRLQRIRLPERARVNAARVLARHPEIEWAAPNLLLPPTEVPDDPQYAVAWHLDKIGAPAAWDLSKGDGVTIAVLDSGVDATHPDLSSKLVPGYNFYENNADTADVYGHGTRVAGAAAAATDNAAGVAAVGWNARVMPIRVAGTNGWASSWAITQGLAWAVDHGARVMNLSFANLGSSQAVADAAAYAVQQGGVVVVSAGNCGCDESTPARLDLLTVGATDETDALAAASSRGSHVDLVAPGVRIWSTDPGGLYRRVSGTSYSSPIVAGIVALMLSANPDLEAADVAALLQGTAQDLGAAGWDSAFGHGRVDAFRALQAAVAAAGPPPDTAPPTASFVSPSPGATVAGTVDVRVSADDDTAVTAVDLYVDGALLARDTSAPFRFFWDTRELPDGLHGLVAVAFDAAGNEGSTGLAVVQVQNVVPDTTPPTALITAPAAGATIGNDVQVRVSATDDVLVESVEAFVDGVSIGTQSCGSPSCAPVFSWNARGVIAGYHEITARAVDGSGRVGDSAPITVILDRSGGGRGARR